MTPGVFALVSYHPPMKFLLVLVMCAAAVAAPAAQTQNPPTAGVAASPAAVPTASTPQRAGDTSNAAQGPTFRAGVDVLAVDVAVVDERGKPVEDLRAPEFTVKIDGAPRKVISATLVRFDAEAARQQVADKSETFYT